MNLNKLHNDIHEGALQLIAEHRTQLFAKARTLCDSEDEANELVIRTIDQAIRKIGTYSGDGDILAWMMAILVHLHTDDHRNLVVRGTRAVSVDELERYAGEDWSTDEQLLKNSDSEAIRNAIRGLDPKLHKVLMMRYYEELSLKEISNVLRLPMGTVAWRLHAARRLLAGKLSVILGRTKKPIAVIATVLSFSFLSFAAVLTGWLADGDDGGRGAPPVQEETVSEPRQKDTPQANTTDTKEDNTMNSRKFTATIVSAILGLTSGAATWNSHSTEPESWFNVPCLWVGGLYPQSGDAVYIYPRENDATVKNGTAVVYIPEGSNVTGIASINLGESGVTHSELQVRPGATLAYTGGLGTPSGGTTAVVVNGGDLQGGSMTVGKGGKFTLIATNGANVQITGGTFAWQHATDIRLEDATFTKTTSGNLILGNGSSYQMNLFAKRSTLSLAKSGQGKGVELGDNGGANTRGAIYLEDSTLTTDGRLRLGRGHNNCAIRLTNSVFAVNYGSSESNLGSEVSSSKTDSGKTNYVDVVGSKSVFSSAGYINAHGNLKLTVADSAQLTITNTGNGVSWSSTVPEGSVQQYLFSNSTVRLTSRTSYNGKMNFSGAGEVRMRQYGGSLTAKSITSAPKLIYELENGILDLRGWAYPEEGKDVFDRTSFHGSRLVLKGANQEYRCHILMNKKTQYVYEIDKTGFNPIKQGKDAGNSNNWVKGAMTIKLTGGLQLLQRKSVEFFHSYNLAGDLGAFDTEEGAFVDPNPQLWACGPHRDPSTFETYGPFKGTGKMGAVLADGAEIASDAHMAEGRSCGWVKMPLVRKPPENPGRVYLDLVPQEGTTLDELIAGFTAAGYPAKKVEMPNANVRIEIPPGLIQPGNGEQVVVFDFNEYPDRDACLNGTPTVRAKVRCIKVVKPQVGLILFLL